LPQKGNTTIKIKNTKYQEKVVFKEGEILSFPDFNLQFVGENSQKVEINPNLLFTYYNFKIIDHEGKSLEISWSSGTGEISPQIFAVGNRVYQLELKADEMVVSPADMDIKEYIMQTTSKFLWFKELDVKMISKRLGFQFTKTEESNEYYDMFKSSGFGPIISAELRVKQKDLAHKLLILEINPGSRISQSMIFSRYPKGELRVNQPENPARTAIITKESWGKVSYSFNKNDILIYITLDSIDS